MKITYIIAPFESPDYLVRCINSIKRQGFADNEIIVAENSFGKDKTLKEYFAGTEDLRLISDSPKDAVQKIREALSLASADSAFIKLISVDTVAAPIASDQVQREADIIVAVCAEKTDAGYKTEEIQPISDSSKLSLHSLFVKKALLEQAEDGVFTERQIFELWLDELIAGGVPIITADEICFYITEKPSLQDSDPVNTCINNKNRILDAVGRTLASNSVLQFDKYLSRLLTFLFDDKCSFQQKKEVFSFIRQLGSLAQGNELAKRLYELYLNGGIEFVQGIDVTDYLLYIDRLDVLSKEPLYRSAVPKPEPAKKPAAAKPEIVPVFDPKPITAEISALKNDIAALTMNMHFVFDSSFSAGASEADRLSDPYNQVPEMFSRGELGMKVILRCLKCWLKYKFKRKK